MLTAAGSAPDGSAALRAPTGRLPRQVRGRDELLDRLTRRLNSPDGRVHVLTGLGGTGKSTVALALAEKAAERGIPAWWVPAVNAETMTARLLELAEDLGAPPGEAAQARAGQRNPADLLWRYLGQRGPWLLIFDNADDPAALTVGDADAASGAGWLRPAQRTTGGLVVITSRNREAATWGRHVELHQVGWLDRADGGRLLTDIAPRAGTADEAEALAERLGGLPLALHHAGSQLASEFATESTFTGYQRSLDDRFWKLMGGHPAAGHGQGRQDDRAIVTSTWELSLDALAAGGRPQARPLLRVLCCLAPAVLIPARLLDVTVLARLCDDDEESAADGLRALASVGLITTSYAPDGSSLGATVHPLVNETSLLRLGTEDPARVGGTAVALLDAATGSLDAERPGDWPAWLQLAPHLNAVYPSVAAELTDRDLAVLAGVTQQAGRAFSWAGLATADLELAASALAYVDRLGADHEPALRLRYRIANASYDLGQLEQAEQDYRRLLGAQARVLGPDHPGTLATRYELARIAADQGQHRQAEHEYRQLLEAEIRVLGADHSDTLTTRYEIARMIARQGRPDEAEHEYRQLLEAETRILGPDHPSTLTTRRAIARVTARQGRPDEAEHELRQLLQAETRILGPDHPGTLAIRYELARIAADQGRPGQAERENRQLLEAETRVLGPDHPDTLLTRYQLAVALHLQGKRQEAQREFRAVLDAQTRVLGADHPSTRATAARIE
jgi:tetratricopeptide (TPR) repeat protein